MLSRVIDLLCRELVLLIAECVFAVLAVFGGIALAIHLGSFGLVPLIGGLVLYEGIIIIIVFKIERILKERRADRASVTGAARNRRPENQPELSGDEE